MPNAKHDISTNSGKTKEPQQNIPYTMAVSLPVPGLSQMVLNHERATSLCSPTSTAAVVRYLSNSSQIDAIDFAQKAWDGGCDIFGNWPAESRGRRQSLSASAIGTGA